MRKLFLRRLPYMLITWGVLLQAVSCTKNLHADIIQIDGKWAKVDDVFMTSEYVEFGSDNMKSFVSESRKLVYDGIVWNSSESDFVEKSSAKYIVSGEMLIVNGEEVGKVSVNDDELTVGDERLIRISGFSDESFCGIDIQEEVTCDYHSGEISVGYKILNPLPDASLAVSCQEDWIEDLTVGEENITFRVSENNIGSARTATITAEYPGANMKVLTVNQSYSSPGINVPTLLELSSEGGEQSIPYSIINPRDGIELQASTSDDWINDIKVGLNAISFSVTTNTSIIPRNGKITLSYGFAEPVTISIQQNDKYISLGQSGTANCYIISNPGFYKFPAVKGNSIAPIGKVVSAEVLWESFGTDVTPQVGDLISYTEYSNDCVYFSTTENFNEGNAVIAGKDASGSILWSWHIWLTDKPEDQVYNNNAGTMMDRNLGATSATPGDVGALGLLYQWGRKDPFLGSSSISEEIEAASSITWPEPVVSTSSTGTIAYAVTNPTTFITYNRSNYDWYYTGSGETDNTRWESSKTIYDPCPPGYRIPDGGDNGVWATAFGSSSVFNENAYDNANKGFNFASSGAGTKKLSSSVSTCWYPTAGELYYSDGSLFNIGLGDCWSCSPFGYYAYYMYFNYYGSVGPSDYYYYRAAGFSVRCLKE